MQYEAIKTTNHQALIDWARNRQGVPGRIRKNSGEPGLGPLKIFFPQIEEREEQFEEITWEEFLEDFENHKLTMSFQENKPDGEISYYYKFEKR